MAVNAVLYLFCEYVLHIVRIAIAFAKYPSYLDNRATKMELCHERIAV